MKKIILTAVVLAIAATGIFFAVKGKGTSTSSDHLQVATSFYPLYEFTKIVGGDEVDVTTLIPPGAEPHDYEPSARELAKAKKADVFVYTGGAFEPWADKFAQDYPGGTVKTDTIVELRHVSPEEHEEGDDHDHEHTDVDPHFWLDPIRAQKVVSAIADELSLADPAHDQIYKKNAAAYNKQLTALDSEFAQGLMNCQQRTIITTHDAYHYLADRYNFSVESIAGFSPNSEPSAARMAEISTMVQANNTPYIFFESLVSTRLADTISQETGAKTLVLDPIEGVKSEDQKQGKNYLSIQRQNLANLRQAMACQ